jgi:protocatechuate 3,4-dioxygenase beta subunit
MKTAPRFSGPVLAFGIVGIAIILAVSWLGYKRQQARSIAPDITESEAVSNPAPAPAAETEVASPPPEETAQMFPDGLPPVIPISLVPHLIEAENSTWLKDEQYKLIPRGTQDFGGIEFHLEGMIQLQGRQSKDWKKRSYRSQVSIPLALINQAEGGIETIERGSNIASVYLMAATSYESETEAVAANLVWHYTDGTSATTPIQFGVHVRDWIREEFEQPDHLPYPFTKVVWTSPVPKQPERALRLYRLGLANPASQKVIQRLDFVGMTGDATLFFTALTLDPVRLGQRPDGTPDLEPTDAVAGDLLQLQVVGPENQPVAKAKVRLQIRRKAGTGNSNLTRNLYTDESGALALKYSADNLERFEVGATHDDYGGRKMIWDLSISGVKDVIPTAYTLKLGEGVTIGGTVVDETNQPVSDAKLNFYRFWMGGDSPNQIGNLPDFQSKTISTDTSGRWQLHGLPKDLLDSIGFSAKHPDFVETNLNLRNNTADETKLRDSTHVLVLKRGLIVKGLVLDESDNPIKDARVRVGRQHYSGTQETKTDADGAFSVRNVVAGVQSFGVQAENFKPVITNLMVKPGMEEIIFRLGAGLKLNGVVKNAAGEPLPGVRISVEGEHGGISQDYNFTATSDNEGRFEWNGAPEEEMKFSFVKTGYESKRRQALKAGAENIVTMRPGRKVQVWVVDAETEQPITKFRAGIGRSYNHFADNDQFYPGSPGMKDYTDANGMFMVELDEEEMNAIKAEADDYAGKVEQLPAAETGTVQITLRLKPSPSLHGVLVNSQGDPVVGATVAITKDNSSFGGNSLQLRKGRLSNNSDTTKVVTTDAEGKFKLGSPPESGGLVIATAESGFARATVDEVRNTGRLALQEFGRIEGTIRNSGSPASGQEVMFSLMNIGISPDWETARASSDAEGKFKFEKLPPGEGQLVRLIKTSPNSWMHSHSTIVQIEPGQTTRVNFGDEGAVIKGQVRMEVPPGEGEEISFSGSLHTKRPDLSHNFATPEEANAFYQSAAWKEQMKQMKHFGVAVNADGSFSVDSIPPGDYTLSVSASKPKSGQDSWNQTQVASGTVTITVPESASPYAPIGISDIILTPVKK